MKERELIELAKLFLVSDRVARWNSSAAKKTGAREGCVLFDK